ncbi:hypothetical protein PEX1_044720 [Penicillium expansum]|uniref:Uncharacterized protein n=1 Tax=Penicillium expansum TaxID=27334 RepID=A0A0A2K3H9_PENEN|nr:hypothetical protein PEX2_093500 [Penicillium expansum]KGO36491.1 hypothetical protein PEX1_044720 [Penicillium expansum]KGO46997.1 hypothetical protein PEXP_063950 [Penicillium expansum]KGO58995.1 hypothetical protein PEX2_093500 [Penicillium expansum]
MVFKRRSKKWEVIEEWRKEEKWEWRGTAAQAGKRVKVRFSFFVFLSFFLPFYYYFSFLLCIFTLIVFLAEYIVTFYLLKTYGISWYRDGGNSADLTRNYKIVPVA